MFVRVENGAVASYPVNPFSEHPNTSFPWDWPGGVVEGIEYARVVPTDVPQVAHNENHIEGTPELTGGVWKQTWLVTEATPEQIAERAAEKAATVRADRNARLARSDWTQINDAPLSEQSKAAWSAYRQALRDVPSQAGFPWTVEWPALPA